VTTTLRVNDSSVSDALQTATVGICIGVTLFGAFQIWVAMRGAEDEPDLRRPGAGEQLAARRRQIDCSVRTLLIQFSLPQ
jgi:hypothetical protein